MHTKEVSFLRILMATEKAVLAGLSSTQTDAA